MDQGHTARLKPADVCVRIAEEECNVEERAPVRLESNVLQPAVKSKP